MYRRGYRYGYKWGLGHLTPEQDKVESDFRSTLSGENLKQFEQGIKDGIEDK
jgi:hypothetical protein